MKKYILTAAVMLSMSAIALASGELRATPRGEPQALATADYGGVSIATQVWNTGAAGTGFSTATIGSGVWYGMIFSTGTNSDFVDVYDSTSSDRAQIEGAITRLYNVNASTGGQGAYPTAGFSGPPKPIRFGKGIIYRPSRGDINRIDTLYYREP